MSEEERKELIEEKKALEEKKENGNWTPENAERYEEIMAKLGNDLF